MVALYHLDTVQLSSREWGLRRGADWQMSDPLSLYHPWGRVRSGRLYLPGRYLRITEIARDTAPVSPPTTSMDVRARRSGNIACGLFGVLRDPAAALSNRRTEGMIGAERHLTPKTEKGSMGSSHPYGGGGSSGAAAAGDVEWVGHWNSYGTTYGSG